MKLMYPGPSSIRMSMSSGLLFQGLASPPLRAKPEETPFLARELAVDSHFQTRSINRSPEAALRGSIIPSLLAAEGHSSIIPSLLAAEGHSSIIPSLLAAEGHSNNVPSPLAGEGQGEGEGIIWPSFLASRRFAPGYPGAMLSLYARG